MSVEDIISSAQAYAGSALSTATSAVSSALSTIGSITSTNVNVNLPPIYAPQPFTPLASPTLQASTMTMPTAPTAPSEPMELPSPFDDIGLAPIFDVADPVISFSSINKPTAMPHLAASPPNIQTSFVMPTAPDLLAPIVPMIGEHAVPTKPAVLLPVFEGIKPDDLDAAPANYAEEFNAAYREAAPTMVAMLDGQIDAMLARFNPQYHTQMAAIESRLSTYLAGGTGLTAAVENAIYERTRDKTNAEFRRTRDGAISEAAKRGFTMPSAALLSSVRQARQAGADNNARASAEIAIKMAELEQQNMQFAVTTSTNLRTTVMSAAISFHQSLISLNGQALDYAKSIMNAMIEVFNLQVQAYAARLEGYRAEASVFETRMRGALANIELYKHEIDALQALTQVDVAKVNIYREQIAGQTALVQMYRTRVDAVVATASLEKVKLELFSEQVQAYSAQTQAKAAEWQAYSAAVNGEEAKARVYVAQVQAYQAEIGGYGARVAAKSEQIRAVSLSNQANANYATAQAETFNALVNAEGRRIEAEISYQAQLVQEYGIANQAALGAANAAVEAYKAQGQISISSAELASRVMIESAQLNIARTKAVADASLAAAGVYGSLAGAAMSGMNTLAAMTTET